MNSLILLFVSAGYLCLLFVIADIAERRSRTGRSLVNNPYIYSLSLAVYCTAWTFYGSVGRAAEHGVQFLTVYIGPTLTAPLWWIILRKIIRICKQQRITNIADFISARYGKSRGLGVFVTVLCLVGIIPYISIQIKAISGSLSLLSGSPDAYDRSFFLTDPAFYTTLLLGIFTILFGTRTLEATERHEGMVTAIAFESLVKLVAFVALGVFVTFGLFDGPASIFSKAIQLPALKEQLTFGPGHTTGDWFWNCLMSMAAVLFLPRQFQVAVVENVDERHLDRAIWLFPLYLFVINLFVLPLAFGGHILLADLPIHADSYVLMLPVQYGQKGLALLAYIGGFSAATGMIIVETIALSVMVSNNVVMPLVIGRPSWQSRVGTGSFVINTRRITILVFLLMAYVYYRAVSHHFSLVSVGLISFAAVAQFLPAVIGGLFWKGGNLPGARLGLWAGSLVWFYTLVLPTLVPALLPAELLTDGPLGIGWLRPQNLFGLNTLEPIAHGMFWSLLANLIGYLWGSANWPQSSIEYNQAILFVDIFKLSRALDNSVVWRGKVLIADLRSLLTTFFGPERANRAILRYAPDESSGQKSLYADAQLVTYTERVLAGAIGTASARTLVASVAKEEPILVDEMIRILKSSQELILVNKELKRKSAELERTTRQLSEANERLKAADMHKDDFLSTVTHEIRTPITSIRALTEIVHDTPDMDPDARQHFLGTVIKESERLTRLINQVLDLERIESGRYQLSTERLYLPELVTEAVDVVGPLATEKAIPIRVANHTEPSDSVWGDRDRLMEVIVNLLSNAIKYSDRAAGPITITTHTDAGALVLTVQDKGIGIDLAHQELIFEKFYQTHAVRQTEKGSSRSAKSGRVLKSSGLGLAITRRIIHLHRGTITLESKLGEGSCFTVRLPLAPEGAVAYEKQ
ncbi:histidine kinase [Rudanella paleaurantiibacter]|uniref:histidine kinase n=1 Tax=Rudanella paleaurantiibacter TaxID=2614655 RepID=A0A7J5TUY2_9BACT|nr:sensor histidine kinase [Rudanella paleaurantiibacter]KAB7727569.1 histidine kinase [Rudanella paleaurantiibacter]